MCMKKDAHKLRCQTHAPPILYAKAWLLLKLKLIVF